MTTVPSQVSFLYEDDSMASFVIIVSLTQNSLLLKAVSS